jgi:hypothetical protein
MKEQLDKWISERFGIDIPKYRSLTDEEAKKSAEYESFSWKYGTGRVWKRKQDMPLLFIRTGVPGKQNQLWIEMKVKGEMWIEVEQMLNDISTIIGEQLCTPSEIAEMKKGRFQHGRVITREGNLIVNVQIDWSRVEIGF